MDLYSMFFGGRLHIICKTRSQCEKLTDWVQENCTWCDARLLFILLRDDNRKHWRDDGILKDGIVLHCDQKYGIDWVFRAHYDENPSFTYISSIKFLKGVGSQSFAEDQFLEMML